MTSLYLLILISSLKYQKYYYKTLNEEVNCTELSPQLVFPGFFLTWQNEPLDEPPLGIWKKIKMGSIWFRERTHPAITSFFKSTRSQKTRDVYLGSCGGLHAPSIQVAPVGPPTRTKPRSHWNMIWRRQRHKPFFRRQR